MAKTRENKMKKTSIIILLVLIPLLLFAQDYKRSEFKHWSDLDKDCQTSRAETLIRYNVGIITFKTDKKCLVISGTWVCPYTNYVYYKAKKLDIDHIIPLKWAWDHGASEWTKEKRKEFANDPENLLAVDAQSNRKKGAKGLNEWIPRNRDFILAYIQKWIYLQNKYDLKE